MDDNVVFDPYNNENREITLNDIQCILRNHGISAKPHNIELYKRAFVHRSYTKHSDEDNKNANVKIAPNPIGCIPLKTKSNERLEFLGDGVLELITKYYLYRRFPKADEGFMTEKKIALVKNENIGKLAYDMKLHKWLLISKHAEEKKIRTNLKKLGCLFEAFIGAIFLDFNKIKVNDEHNWFKNVFVTGPGFQMAQIFVENVFESYIDFTELVNTDDNYKNILQVIIQKEFKTTPEYIELSYDMDTGYNMGVYLCIDQNIHHVDISSAINLTDFDSLEKLHDIETPLLVFMGSAEHKIKKKAEQSACKQILKVIAPI